MYRAVKRESNRHQQVRNQFFCRPAYFEERNILDCTPSGCVYSIKRLIFYWMLCFPSNLQSFTFQTCGLMFFSSQTNFCWDHFFFWIDRCGPQELLLFTFGSTTRGPWPDWPSVSTRPKRPKWPGPRPLWWNQTLCAWTPGTIVSWSTRWFPEIPVFFVVMNLAILKTSEVEDTFVPILFTTFVGQNVASLVPERRPTPRIPPRRGLRVLGWPWRSSSIAGRRSWDELGWAGRLGEWQQQQRLKQIIKEKQRQIDL